MLAPFLLLILVHLRNPVLAPYAQVSLAPFFILVASRGVFRLKKKIQKICLVTIALLCLFSIYQAKNIPNPVDYKALAKVLTPEVQKGDLLLVDNEWYSAPIIYYFPPSKYELSPTSAVLANQAPGNRDNTGIDYTRFWLIDFISSDEEQKKFDARKRSLPPALKEVKQLRTRETVATLFKSDRPVRIPLDQRF